MPAPPPKPSPPSKRTRLQSNLHLTPVTNPPDVTISAPNLPLVPSLGPLLQVQSKAADGPDGKALLLALESGLPPEVSWALNVLNLLSYSRKHGPPATAVAPSSASRPGTASSMNAVQGLLSSLPGLVDALLLLIDSWHQADLAAENLAAPPSPLATAHQERPGSLGATPQQSRTNGPIRTPAPSSSAVDAPAATASPSPPSSTSPWATDADPEILLVRLQQARAAGNVLRNLSFFPENQPAMAGHEGFQRGLLQVLQRFETEDEEVVTNALDTLVNLSTSLHLSAWYTSSQGGLPAPVDSTEQRRSTVSRHQESGKEGEDMRWRARGRRGGEGEEARGRGEGREVHESRALPEHHHPLLLALLRFLDSDVLTWQASAADSLARLAINPANDDTLVAFGPQVYPVLSEFLVGGGLRPPQAPGVGSGSGTAAHGSSTISTPVAAGANKSPNVGSSTATTTATAAAASPTATRNSSSFVEPSATTPAATPAGGAAPSTTSSATCAPTANTHSARNSSINSESIAAGAVEARDPEVVAMAVAALANMSELSCAARWQIARTRGTLRRLLSIVRSPHLTVDIVRKAACALESISQEPRALQLLKAFEGQVAEVAMSDNKASDWMARILQRM